MKDTTIAVDLAKNVFEIAISGEAGKVSKRLRVSRPKLVSFLPNRALPPCFSKPAALLTSGQVSMSTIIDGKPPIFEHVRRRKGVLPLK